MLNINPKDTTPIQQGLFSVAFITVISLCCLLFGVRSMLSWSMIMSPFILFCCYNPIFGIFKQKPIPYFCVSVIILIILAMYVFLSGNFVSDFSYKETQELHLIAALITVFYVMLNMLCIVFRVILHLLVEADK